jgi:hypothetical protein
LPSDSKRIEDVRRRRADPRLGAARQLASRSFSARPRCAAGARQPVAAWVQAGRPHDGAFMFAGDRIVEIEMVADADRFENPTVT